MHSALAISGAGPARQGGCSHGTSLDDLPCPDCPIRRLIVSGSLLGFADRLLADEGQDWQIRRAVRARRNIKTAGEDLHLVRVICDGWAFRYLQLPDRRRQILSIFIPGDVITPTRLFDAKVRFSVQALTDVHFWEFDSTMLRARLANDPHMLDAWANLIVAERQRHLGLLIDLGSCTAEERIVHLLLDLSERLERRGIAFEGEVHLPLSQKIIAAATALTPEYVSKIMTSFRRLGLLDTGNGSVTLLDVPGLQRLAALRY